MVVDIAHTHHLIGQINYPVKLEWSLVGQLPDFPFVRPPVEPKCFAHFNIPNSKSPSALHALANAKSWWSLSLAYSRASTSSAIGSVRIGRGSVRNSEWIDMPLPGT